MMFFFSCFIGIGGGLLCSFLLKLLRKVHLSRVQETSLIIFFAFLTYLTTEMLHFSPIIALLFCGIFMSHYAFYNLSFQAREESSIVSKILANIAEGFVFTYLGLTSISISHDSFCLSFIILVFLFVLVGRFLAVYGISLILNIFKLKIFSFDMSERGITFFAGCIRGAIAFGLAISMPEDAGDGEKNKQMLISSTLILVFITTLLFGALMSPIVKFFTKGKSIKRNTMLESEFIGEDFKSYSLQGFDGETLTIGDFENFLEKPRFNSNRIEGLWNKIDEKILKPIFIDNYKDAREEHSQIAKDIMQLFENHEKQKMKKKAIKSFKKNYGITMPDSDNDTDNINGIEMKENDEIDTSTNLSDIKKLDDSQ
jgi:NhaP-type Na+/H+ or K+/H+ antiporter